MHTAPLALDESLTAVTARAAGFAPLIAMFCHAWPGGLARDLLRAPVSPWSSNAEPRNRR